MKQRHQSHSPPASRQLLGRLLGAGAVALALVAPARALAQADLSPPPPDVLLLVDTSGSMDYKSGSNAFPACFWSGTTPTGTVNSERSRWIDLVEVLTGTIADYQCQRLDRNSSLFTTEYKLGAQNPYDFLYPNPYNRPASNGCVAGPGVLSGNLFPPGYIKTHSFDNLASSCAFNQASDGVLDSFLGDVRFGLMTFDTEVDGDTGVNGLWSYYMGSATQGKPADCPSNVDQEVGVRNPTAPPWEGRAVGFGNPAAGSTDFQTRNAWIQNILLATRPFGATPIAGMLDDARAFLLTDPQSDPVDSSFDFGPKDDPATCRKQSIILLSDGQPNLDLRPYCEPNPADCPYDKSETIAADLRSRGIDLFVIGFALAQVDVNGTPTSCKSFTAADLVQKASPSDPDVSLCDVHKNDPNIQACCALNRIAAAGGHVATDDTDEDWTHAHFADNRDELREALSRAIGANFPKTSRTASVPATGAGFVGGDADLAFARGFRFGAAFEPGTAGQGWVGSLTRSRYVCEEVDDVNVPKLLQPVVDKGDDFVANINKSGPDARRLYTVLSSSPSASTIRPNLAVADIDGAGTNTGTFEHYDDSAQAFVSAITPASMGLVDGTCVYAGVSLTATQCRDRVMKWLVGLDNGTVNQRCANVVSGDCSLVGDFFHSSPKPVAGRPNALLNDKSYDDFVEAQLTAQRPSVLYASSNDGFLHAFKMAPLLGPGDNEEMSTRTLETNELWAFVPPGVLPNVRGSYPGAHQLLLDGTPTVKDVVATYDAAATGYKYTLERSKGNAETGSGTWRTILVQSFGRQYPGYFALDVTDPVVEGNGGPKFLWQLITDEDGNQLFGSGGGTPLITTVFINNTEVAVAVLPGGYGSAADASPPSANCNRQTDISTFPVGFKPRAKIPCYTNPDLTAQRARSLTVVRLDNGKILRTFRQAVGEMPKLNANNLVTVAPLDSPLTGQPVAFPAEVGAVADRVFIGDQDGTLWRLNFASTGSPADWRMDLFFDAYPGDGTFLHTANDGQPIVTPPALSVDRFGNLTVAFSTGDQDAIGDAPGLVNYVWSLVETPNADRSKLSAVPQWHLDFKGADAGYRVIGSMALFASNLYFAAMNRPDTGLGACSQGEGRIYAMHYLEPHASGTAGRGGLVNQSFVGATSTYDYMPASELIGSAEAFLGGVSIGQQPTCENPGLGSDDDYFKYGAHFALGTPTTGKFQLFVSTGSAPTTSTRDDITAVDQGGANAAAIDLANPSVTTRIDSWASIVE